MRRILERLALHRPELRAWALYDWANSAFVTTVIAAVFPIYFAGLYGEGADIALAAVTTIALAVVAVLAPILGAFADHAPVKKKLLAAFLALGVASTLGLALIGRWQLAAVLFALGNIGAMTSFVFYDALLPHIASDDEVDRVSTAGYALGYVGGGLLLGINLLWILKPGWFGLPDAAVATRVAFASVAVWWLLFALPLFKRVSEPEVELARERLRGFALAKRSFSGLARTFRELKRYRQALLFLFAFLIYNDGIGTIIRLAAAYGTAIGLERGDLITAILVVQFVGIPFTFAFGQLAGKLGTKPSIFVGLTVYLGVSVLGYYMTSAVHFYVLAGLVGLVQGGTQALSRSLFASMIPRAKSSEFFGLFAVFEKFAGILGPALFTLVGLASDSSRAAILSIALFFLVGGGLLAFVDVGEGRRVARAANAGAGA